MAERQRRRDLAIEGRSRKWASRIVGVGYRLVVTLVVLGTAAVTVSYSFKRGWLGIVVGAAVLVLAGLELFGVLSYLRSLRASLELRLQRRIREWLRGEAARDEQVDQGNLTDQPDSDP